MSTRKASGKVLNALTKQLPELWGGSADLAGSNNTTLDGENSFLPPELSTEDWTGDLAGRNLHFGIREHAMGGIVNGMCLEGLTRPYCGTFFVFSDYMRPPVRLAALMKLPSIFVWTHDSIGVGEDGPTHQPVEHLAAYRAIPGLSIVRPADANETVVAWREILKRTDQPAGLVLTRQDVPTVDRAAMASAEGVARGAYVLRDLGEEPQLILLATGSEVQLSLAAQDSLWEEGIASRVVSMTCLEWFAEQDADYQESVLPAAIKARVSVEAGISQGWHRYVGDLGEIVSLEHYGASGKGTLLFEEFGFTPQRVVAAAKATLAKQNN